MRKRAHKPEEEDEEEDEVLRYAKQFYNNNMKDEYIFKSLAETEIGEFDLLISCIQVDVLINMLRLEMKEGAQKEKLKYEKAETMKSMGANEIDLIKKQQNLEGIADNLIKKINLMKEKGSTEIKNTTAKFELHLKNTGKFGETEIRFSDYEKRLDQESNQNLYFKSILYIMFALNRSQAGEQEKLLKKSLSMINK